MSKIQIDEQLKVRILKGRKAVDAYKDAHTQLHFKPWHRGIPEEHTPLLEKLLSELQRQGFSSRQEFSDASLQLEIEEVADKVSNLKGRTFRLIDRSLMDAFTANATLDVMAQCREQDLVPDTVTIYLPQTAWIGLGSGFTSDMISKENCIAYKVSVVDVSSVSSGGVALFSKGVDQLWLFTKGLLTETTALDYYSRLMINILRHLGIDAYRRERSNDVLIASKKVCGIGFSIKGDVCRIGAMLSLDFDYELADKVLTIPLWKFEGKAVDNIRDWVTSVKESIGKNINKEEYLSALINAYKDVFDVNLVLSELTKQEMALIDQFKSSKEYLQC